MKEATGIIKWFYDEKKFGFIQPDEGERVLFIHEKFIADPGLIPPRVGMKIQYMPHEGPKGLEARNVRSAGPRTTVKKKPATGIIGKSRRFIKKTVNHMSAKVTRPREKSVDKIATYYPRFKSAEDLTSHYHKALWYLPRLPGILENVYMFRRIAGDATPGNRPPYMFQAHRDGSHILVKKGIFHFVKRLYRSRLILVWKNYNPTLWKFLKYFGFHAVNIDADDLSSKEYGRYCDLFWVELLDKKEKFKILSENYRRFYQVASGIKEKKYSCSSVFGTGPSLEKAYDFDFRGCLTIVCNSIIQNSEMMAHINPQFICAGDVVSHFGVSRYAEKFREDLLKTLQARDIYFFTTASFGYLLTLNHPEIREKTILVEQAVAGPNYDLLHGFGLPLLASTLNIHMLPLAATFSDEIFLLGCDGKSTEKDNEDFWAHAKSSQYNELVDSGHRCHPTFAVHRRQSTYRAYLQSIESFIATGEKKYGKTFLALRPSNIPILRSRQIPGGGISAKENEKVVVADLLKSMEKVAGKVEIRDLPILSNLFEVVYSANGSLYIKGWVLSPTPVERIDIFAGELFLGTTMLKFGTNAAMNEKYPEYDEKWLYFEFYGEINTENENLNLVIKFFSNRKIVKELVRNLKQEKRIKGK